MVDIKSKYMANRDKNKVLYDAAKELKKIVHEPEEEDPEKLLKTYMQAVKKWNKKIQDRFRTAPSFHEYMRDPEKMSTGSLQELQNYLLTQNIGIFQDLDDIPVPSSVRAQQLTFTFGGHRDSVAVLAYVPQRMKNAELRVDGSIQGTKGPIPRIAKSTFDRADSVEILFRKASGEKMAFPVEPME